MFQIISVVQKKSSLSEFYGSSGSQITSFSFGSSVQKYTFYVFIVVLVLILIRVVVRAIRSASEKEEIIDSPYRLRKLPTRLEHFKEIISEKKTFTYRFFDKREEEHETWQDGKFLSIDGKNHLTVVLHDSTGKPGEPIDKALEIKYSIGKSNALVKSSLLKYLDSKKTGKNIIVRMYEIKLPLVVNLEPRRKGIRFEVPPDYSIRVYLLPDKLDIPVAANCIDFSSGGMLIELENAKTGCLDYLMKRDKVVTMNDLDKKQAGRLTLFEVLSQPELGFGEARKTKEKVEPNLTEHYSSIKKSNDFISSIKKDDKVKLFFVLPELEMMEESGEEPIPADNRTIMCNAVVNNKTVDEKTAVYRVALNFLDIDNTALDIIHQYGLETCR